jgi:L-amino acid N-acyltransferase YncA
MTHMAPDAGITFRIAARRDAASIAKIYGHHVLNGTATYDTVPPSYWDMRTKLEHVLRMDWPILVAEVSNKVVAYAYVTQFRDRAAYAFTCEDSIYVHSDWVGRGIGTRLLQKLCARAEARGFRQMIAVVGGAEEASIRLHRRCGFRTVGRLHAVGWKFGRWLDSVYMQLSLGDGSKTPPAAF